MKIAIISSIILCLLYVFLVPTHTKDSDQIVRRSYVSFSDLDSLAQGENSEEFLFSENSYQGGFISKDLQRGAWLSNNYKIFQNEEYIISYTPFAESLYLWDAFGGLIGQIPNTGIPILGQSYIVLLKKNSMGVQWYSLQGQLLDQRDYTKLITVLDLVNDTLALGFIDGAVEVIDLELVPGTLPKMEIRNPVSLTRSSSVPNVVYGVSFLNGSDYLAVISGLSPQHFEVYRIADENMPKVFSEDLPLANPSPIWMEKTQHHGLFFEISDDLFSFSLENNALSWIPLPSGQIQAVASINADYIAFMVQSSRGSNIGIFDKMNQLKFQQKTDEFLSFSAKDDVLAFTNEDGLGLIEIAWSSND